MRMCPNNSFDTTWKKQVIVFQLLSLLHVKRRKYKMALKAIYAAQKIVSDLDENVGRNSDYLLAVNTLTSYLLLQIEKPQEAVEFILIAEKVAA